MFSSPWAYVIIVAIFIIVALVAYTVKLLLKLKTQNALQQQATKDHEKALQQHDNKVLSSVVIIVRAMKEEQCDYAEGCWRLCVLLDSLKNEQSLEQQFPAIFELYAAIKHMPILEERKQLAKQQRMKFDLERMKVEARLNDQIKHDLELLHQYAISQISN